MKTYLHSCQPLVLKLALETLATDQTHLRHHLSITLLTSSPHRVTFFCWPATMPAVISSTTTFQTLFEARLAVSAKMEAVMLNHLLLVEEVQVSKTQNIVGSPSHKRDASFTVVREAGIYCKQMCLGAGQIPKLHIQTGVPLRGKP